MSFYKKVLKPVFFQIDPEWVHNFVLKIGSFLGGNQLTRRLCKYWFHTDNPALAQTLHNIHFPNPIGLSAGFDKDGDLVDILPSFSFGFTQVGTVTHNAYEGNPKPRLMRLKKSKGIVVWYGLKNIGATKIMAKLAQRKTHDIPVSISIGKTNQPYTKDLDAGIKDYVDGLIDVMNSDQGDFYTLNISCPNTFGGEPFTTPERLERLLEAWFAVRPSKPTFVKMPINPTWEEFKKLLDVTVKFPIAGVIIGNLNKDRSDSAIKDSIPSEVKGSVSGLPTKQLCNNLIRQTYAEYGDKLTIIGVGGVFSAEDAYEKIKLGASLVQLITGMIFEGPGVTKKINQGLVRLMKADGYINISQAVGVDNQT